MITVYCRFGIALAVLAALAVPAAAQPVQVESIRAQLFNERTGELSADITTGEIPLWNVIIGTHQANSFLLSVEVSGKRESYDERGTVLVTVIDDESKKRIKRQRFTGMLFDQNGRTIKPMLIDDHNCSRVRIIARTKAGEKTVVIPFKCGE